VRSPLILKETIYNCRNAIRSLIDSRIRTVVFVNSRDMELEFYYSSSYNIIPHTLDYRIQDFWDGYLLDPERVFSIAKDLCRTLDMSDYKLLAELYLAARDRIMRASLLLLMNRCGQHVNFFRDSFCPKSALEVLDFLQSHRHFILREVSVKTATIQRSLTIPNAFAILDLPKPSFQKAIPISEDTSFITDTLIELLNERTNWCLISDSASVTERMLSSFEHFNINNKGYRTASDTNKILFFKNN